MDGVLLDVDGQKVELSSARNKFKMDGADLDPTHLCVRVTPAPRPLGASRQP